MRAVAAVEPGKRYTFIGPVWLLATEWSIGVSKEIYFFSFREKYCSSVWGGMIAVMEAKCARFSKFNIFFVYFAKLICLKLLFYLLAAKKINTNSRGQLGNVCDY